MSNWPIPDIGSEVPRKALELNHVDYDDRIEDWKFFRHSDELTGGYKASVATYTRAEDPPDFELSYLVPHEKEDDTEFSRRVSLANPPRFVQEGITSIVGVLTQQPPNRTEYPDDLQDWMSAVTFDGVSWQQFIATEVAPLVERYGVCYTLARRPTVFGETEGDQRRNREAEGIPAVLSQIINPEALQWWIEDDNGQFEIIRYLETVVDLVEEDGYVVEEKDIDRHWYITHEGWWYIDDPKDDGVKNREGLLVVDRGFWESEGTDLQHFPVSKWALKDDKGPTEPASFAQLAYYRAESEMKKIEEAMAFPMTWVPVEASDANPAETVKSPDVIAGFQDQSKHVPMILEPSGVSFSHYVNDRLPGLEEQSLSPYGRQREVGGNDSGVALAHIQETAKNIWRQQSKSFSQSEFGALLPVAELLGVDFSVENRADWPTVFGTLADSKQMEQIETFIGLEPGPEFNKFAILKASEVVLGDLTQKQKDDGIEAWDTEQEEKKTLESEEADIFAQESQAKIDGIMAKPAAMNPAQLGGPKKER